MRIATKRVMQILMQKHHSYLRQCNSQRKSFGDCYYYNCYLDIIQVSPLNRERGRKQKTRESTCTAIVTILITLFTMSSALLWPFTNWTFPSGFLVFPVKYLGKEAQDKHEVKILWENSENSFEKITASNDKLTLLKEWQAQKEPLRGRQVLWKWQPHSSGPVGNNHGKMRRFNNLVLI